MTIDPAAVLAVISDLASQIAALRSENAQLRAALANAKPNEEPPVG